MVKRWIKANNDKVSQVLEYENGQRVEIPLNKDGTVRWLEEKIKIQEKQK